MSPERGPGEARSSPDAGTGARMNVAVSGKPTDERRRGAEKRVLRALERRWSFRLPGGRFPDGFVRELRHHPRFRRIISDQIRSDAIRLLSLENLGAGQLQELMLEELGGDPADFICVDCHREVPKGQDRCRPCAKWRKTGVRS